MNGEGAYDEMYYLPPVYGPEYEDNSETEEDNEEEYFDNYDEEYYD